MFPSIHKGIELCLINNSSLFATEYLLEANATVSSAPNFGQIEQKETTFKELLCCGW